MKHPLAALAGFLLISAQDAKNSAKQDASDIDQAKVDTAIDNGIQYLRTELPRVLTPQALGGGPWNGPEGGSSAGKW